jgi:hypothetical protein
MNRLGWENPLFVVKKQREVLDQGRRVSCISYTLHGIAHRVAVVCTGPGAIVARPCPPLQPFLPATHSYSLHGCQLFTHAAGHPMPAAYRPLLSAVCLSQRKCNAHHIVHTCTHVAPQRLLCCHISCSITLHADMGAGNAAAPQNNAPCKCGLPSATSDTRCSIENTAMLDQNIRKRARDTPHKPLCDACSTCRPHASLIKCRVPNSIPDLANRIAYLPEKRDGFGKVMHQK